MHFSRLASTLVIKQLLLEHTSLLSRLLTSITSLVATSIQSRVLGSVQAIGNYTFKTSLGFAAVLLLMQAQLDVGRKYFNNRAIFLEQPLFTVLPFCLPQSLLHNYLQLPL